MILVTESMRTTISNPLARSLTRTSVGMPLDEAVFDRIDCEHCWDWIKYDLGLTDVWDAFDAATRQYRLDYEAARTAALRWVHTDPDIWSKAYQRRRAAHAEMRRAQVAAFGPLVAAIAARLEVLCPDAHSSLVTQ